MSQGATASPPPKPAEPKARRGWKRLGGSFLLISIGLHLLFLLGAGVYVVQSIQAKRKLTFQGGPPSPNKSQRAIEHKVQLAKQQKNASAPAPPKRVAVAGLAKVTLPDLPALPLPPMKDASAMKMGGMSAAPGGLGFGTGGLAGSAGGGSSGGGVPLFGFRDTRGGGALVGTFYDLKQEKFLKPSGVTHDSYPEVLSKFVNGAWNPVVLQRFFASPAPLYATQFFIPKIDANEGPKAFNLAGRVQPSLWVIHYKGKVIAPDTGTYRFVGMADDVLVVKFNGRVVLDCGTTNPSGRKPQKFYASEGLNAELMKKFDWYKGLGVGDTFQVQAGSAYDMEVLLGEWPGGEFKAYLLIEKEGVEHRKDAKGNPLLPIFKVSEGQPIASNGEAPVFDKTGPVWKAEKAPAAPSR